jgi:hypothetical protein
VEEGILDIELMNHLVLGEGERGKLDDGAEGLVVVDFGALGEAPKDPMSLVAVERAIQG